MRAAFSGQAVAAGLLAGFVGFASSFAVVLQGLRAMGASPVQATSGLMALSITMGLGGVLLSLWSRMPISLAWSTPGGALLAASQAPDGGFAGAVGAFLVCGGLIMVAGLFRPLGRLVAAIPPALAHAMLAGVLLPLCLAPVRAVAEMPGLAIPVVLAWAIMAKVRRLLAVPAAVLVAGLLILVTHDRSVSLPVDLFLMPRFVPPEFSVAAIVGLSLPLFVVTMTSQNVPGIAVLAAHGFRPNPGPLFVGTGVLSLAAAPFGGHAVNLAAITAALCASPDAHPDRARRYWAATIAGAVYVVFGLLAGVVTGLASVAPPLLLQAIAGLALLGTISGALLGAMQSAPDREAATVTFLLAASGLGFLGIGGAFWGLVAGGTLLAAQRWRAG